MASLREYQTGLADVHPADTLSKGRFMEKEAYTFNSGTHAIKETADRSDVESKAMSERDRYIMLSSLF